MMQRRNSRALLSGGVLLVISLFAASAAQRDVEPVRDQAPMDAVLEEAGSNEVRWDLPVTYNDRVEHWINFLKTDNRSKTDLWLERSSRYTPMIRSELRRRGMPEDLIYLAFIESGYSPNARSNAAAVGLWQFIAETGKRYGLEVSSYVDERRDPFKATNAALDYLQVLYKRFGSWYLAAAAYNTGENRVARIMREVTGSEGGDDADFWRIAPRLPLETRNYVPLMLAAAHIGKEPEKYGFVDVDYQGALAFETVPVPGGVPLVAVAKATNTSETEIADMNPELVRRSTPPKRVWSVRVPVATSALFARNFEAALKTVRAQPTYASATHRVKRGETLSGIAKRYGVSVSSLLSANGHVRPSRLQIGQSIRVPRVASGGASRAASRSRYHRVRRGENLSVIANRYDTTVTSLKRLNALRSTVVHPGQRLRVS